MTTTRKCPLHFSGNPMTQKELALQGPQIRRLARAGAFGKTRHPTKAEREQYGLQRHTVILDGGRVQRAADRREKARIDARIALKAKQR